MPGKQFENFYWVEGPLPGDQGCRITVLHNNQQEQCAHCLRRMDNCPALAKGKACAELKTPRGKIADYMKHLKTKHGYTSLKMRYLEQQERSFPSLDGTNNSFDGFGHMVEPDSEDGIRNAEADELNNKTEKIARKDAGLHRRRRRLQQQKLLLLLRRPVL